MHILTFLDKRRDLGGFTVGDTDSSTHNSWWEQSRALPFGRDYLGGNGRGGWWSGLIAFGSVGIALSHIFESESFVLRNLGPAILVPHLNGA